MKMVWLILCVVLVVGLQIFLSKAQRKWPGLILPGISVLTSLIYPLNLMAGSDVWEFFIVWILANIPTVVLLAIYFACRPKAV